MAKAAEHKEIKKTVDVTLTLTIDFSTGEVTTKADYSELQGRIKGLNEALASGDHEKAFLQLMYGINNIEEIRK